MGSSPHTKDTQIIRGAYLFAGPVRPFIAEKMIMEGNIYGKPEEFQRNKSDHPVPHFLCEHLGSEIN